MTGRPRPQVKPEHYGPSYDTRGRFLSYWNQIDLVRRAAPETLLEVGIGNGFVSRYLRAEGINSHTVDVDPDLSPDTVASVTELPFADGQFDVVCCFETLEHLPWEDFVPALRELKRVARRQVLLSLPDVTPYFRLSLGMGFRRWLMDRSIDYPQVRPRAHQFDGQHHWEIGKHGYRLGKVKRCIQGSGLSILRMHRDYEDPYHRFLVCAVGQSPADVR